MKTQFVSQSSAQANRKWYVIDATDKVVGRLATKIASILRGKGKGTYAPQSDAGDFVIVVNAEKLRFTGTKPQKKVYHHHTGYVGNLKSETAEKLMQRKPENVLKLAVKGMLPKNNSGKAQIAKLKIYRGATHPHQAQQAVVTE